MWPLLCFDNFSTKVPSGRNHQFCHAGMGYCRCFRALAKKSLHFSFLSSLFGLESLPQWTPIFIPLQVFSKIFSTARNSSKDIWPDLIDFLEERSWSSAFYLKTCRSIRCIMLDLRYTIIRFLTPGHSLNNVRSRSLHHISYLVTTHLNYLSANPLSVLLPDFAMVVHRLDRVSGFANISGATARRALW